MLPKGPQKWLLNRQKPNWNLDRIPVLLFIIYDTQNGVRNPWKQLNSLCKTTISEKYPFPLRGCLGFLKSHKSSTEIIPKPLQQNIPKTRRDLCFNFIDFGFKMTPQMNPKASKTRPVEHCGATREPRRPRRVVQGPLGT